MVTSEEKEAPTPFERNPLKENDTSGTQLSKCIGETYMARRNLLEEILAKRARSPTGNARFDLFGKRYDRLREAFVQLLDRLSKSGPESTTVDVEVMRHFPVALVACIEGYFRQAITDLIDKGSPFIERVAKLHDINISLDAAAAIQTRKVSLGEYISHFLSLSSLDEINRALSVLLDFDFLDRIVSSRGVAFFLAVMVAT